LQELVERGKVYTAPKGTVSGAPAARKVAQPAPGTMSSLAAILGGGADTSENIPSFLRENIKATTVAAQGSSEAAAPVAQYTTPEGDEEEEEYEPEFVAGARMNRVQFKPIVKAPAGPPLKKAATVPAPTAVAKAPAPKVQPKAPAAAPLREAPAPVAPPARVARKRPRPAPAS
jgi:hypothetical protein